MTTDLVTISANTIMTEIDKIFKKEEFHHLPVLDDQKKPVGILSKSDYKLLLNHFTLKKVGEYERSNRMFFRALLAKEVMTKNLISINDKTPILEALNLFIKNKVSSAIVINDQGTCVGICTPIDILKWVSNNQSNL